MNFILGSHGRLGQAIATNICDPLVALDRDVYSNWWRQGSADLVAQFFEKYSCDNGIVYIATGIIDPKIPNVEHDKVNFLMAKHVIEGVSKLGFRVVTFGTIMEEIINPVSANPYILSKIKLRDFVYEFTAKHSSISHLHIRIHTLYGGGIPDKFMFLGQLYNAITSKTPFYMTSGLQLREYHHIDDEAKAILAIAESNINGVINLSHGKPVTLKELAEYVFKQFNCISYLKLGALTQPVEENYGILFDPTPTLASISFRETLPGVYNYLNTCIASI